MLRKADRIATVPPYLFATIDKKRKEAQARGVDIINLGIGDPDQPAPTYVVDKLAAEAATYHRYPDYEGALEFRQAAADYYQRRFGVTADPKNEVVALIGSKEGLSHLVWAFVDPGDVALVPDPAYPVYRTQTLLAGGIPVAMPLLAENGFLPDLDAIDPAVAAKATIMFLNYPNNPTAGVADLAFFEKAVAFCKKYKILLCHDNAYAEMTYDDFTAPSVLQVPGAKDIAVESYSLSKPYNMTGWRIAFMIGNAEAIGALGIIKTNTDSGQFTAIQMAGIEAMKHQPEAFVGQMNRMYKGRRDVLIGGLRKLGWDIEAPKGSFYAWIPVPKGYTSAGFAETLLDKAGIIVTPGNAYGDCGEGYVRFALTVDERRMQEAVDRIGKVLKG